MGILIGVMFVAGGGTMETNMGTDFVVLPPYTWSFAIPKHYLGPVNVTAAGRVLGQKTGTAPMAELNLVADLPSFITLKSLRVRDDQRMEFIRVSRTRTLYVYGQFSDGIERQVSSSALGTTYQSTDATIATVDSEGMIAAKSVGKTTITVKNGSAQLKVEVHVLPPKVSPSTGP
ncbi:MAG: Ig-like domain-containing protein [Nitrospiria bacterium]